MSSEILSVIIAEDLNLHQMSSDGDYFSLTQLGRWLSEWKHLVSKTPFCLNY